MVSVEPAGQQKFRREHIGSHFLQIPSSGRHQRPTLQDDPIDAATVVEHGVAKLVGRGEALNVQAATRCHDNAPERSRKAQSERRVEWFKDERNIKFRDRLENVDQPLALGDAGLQAELAVHAFSRGNGIQTSGCNGRSSHGWRSVVASGETLRNAIARRGPRLTAR
jgi:hypothetical protein